MLISKGHHDSTWYHQDCPHAVVPSDSNHKHLCFPPVALLLVQLPWWRFHPKGCSPSPGRDASLAPGGPWKPPNGFQNGPDFWGGKRAVVEGGVCLPPLEKTERTAVQRNYEFGTHFKYCQSEVKQKSSGQQRGVHLKVYQVMPPQWFKKGNLTANTENCQFFFWRKKSLKPPHFSGTS